MEDRAFTELRNMEKDSKNKLRRSSVLNNDSFKESIDEKALKLSKKMSKKKFSMAERKSIVEESSLSRTSESSESPAMKKRRKLQVQKQEKEVEKERR